MKYRIQNTESRIQNSAHMKLNRKPSRLLVSTLTLLSIAAPVFAQKASAQEFELEGYKAEEPDLSDQVDITRGMAEQNGLYAMKKARVPIPVQSGQQQFLQGYANQNQPGFFNGQIQNGQVMPLMGNAMNQQLQGDALNPQMQGYAMNPQMQGYVVNPQMQGYVVNPQMQGYVVNPQMQGYVVNPQMQGYPMNPVQQGQANSGESLSLSSFGIKSTQVVGVMGAAMMLNYITTGGGKNVMSSMGARGWGGRRHTFGSCVGGNVYH